MEKWRESSRGGWFTFGLWNGFQLLLHMRWLRVTSPTNSWHSECPFPPLPPPAASSAPCAAVINCCLLAKTKAKQRGNHTSRHYARDGLGWSSQAHSVPLSSSIYWMAPLLLRLAGLVYSQYYSLNKGKFLALQFLETPPPKKYQWLYQRILQPPTVSFQRRLNTFQLGVVALWSLPKNLKWLFYFYLFLELPIRPFIFYVSVDYGYRKETRNKRIINLLG